MPTFNETINLVTQHLYRCTVNALTSFAAAAAAKATTEAADGQMDTGY
jgi:hypothetical protein